jgi:hypothetical protein
MGTPYKRVSKVECGANMASNNSRVYGNTCFFNSLKTGLIQFHAASASLNYSDFLAIGGWNDSFQGQMVDTESHAVNLHQLANNLGVKISVFTEILPGVTNSTIYAPFGTQGPEIRIIRLRGFAHFNLMLWHADQVMIEADCRLAMELEKNMLKEEEARRQKQVSDDEAMAKAEQEKYNKIAQQREDARYQAMRKQVSDDEAMAKALSAMNF